jgi:hypothetical protein
MNPHETEQEGFGKAQPAPDHLKVEMTMALSSKVFS